MPTVIVNRKDFFKRLGRHYTDDEFRKLCFEFGIELDEVTTKDEMLNRMNRLKLKKEGAAAQAPADEEYVYKIDVSANRYDLLCIEGLVMALRVFLGLEQPPKLRAVNPPKMLKMIAHKSVLQVRPLVACAVLRNITFDEDSYNSFIDLQDKLHKNICRRRTLVSIGTHDLDTVEGPFSYEALPPSQIKFIALKSNIEENATQLFARLHKEEKEQGNPLGKYLHIIEDSPVYPVIYDAKRRVMSLPPIINGEHSKITVNTKNVFIEVTATDRTKMSATLNIMVGMFSIYCKEKFTVENVEVVDADGKSEIWPDLREPSVSASVDYINKAVGITLKPDDMLPLLRKMSLESTLSSDKSQLVVHVPPTRSDIMHACDIMEEVAIGYGFNKLVPTYPKTITIGKQQPLSQLTDLLRNELAQQNYSELLTLSLCSRDENFAKLNQKDNNSAVVLANPKTIEFQVGRTSLLPGLLKSIHANKGMPLPLRLFEVSDVMLLDPASETGARNKRMLVAAFYNNLSSGFEQIHGLLDRVMSSLKVHWKFQQPKVKKEKSDDSSDEEDAAPAPTGPVKPYYEIVDSKNDTFFPGRRADIILNDEKTIGTFGILHPSVLRAYELTFPCSVLNLEIEHFL